MMALYSTHSGSTHDGAGTLHGRTHCGCRVLSVAMLTVVVSITTATLTYYALIPCLDRLAAAAHPLSRDALQAQGADHGGTGAALALRCERESEL